MIAGYTLSNAIAAMECPPSDDEFQAMNAHYTGDTFKGNIHTQRGNAMESEALEALWERVDGEFRSVGMCLMGDDETSIVSCSPDSLIYKDGVCIAGAEVKCPSLAVWYRYAVDGALPIEYKLQVHASMAITGIETWHFGAFFPGMPILHIPVKWDDFTSQVERSLIEFRELYEVRWEEVVDNIKKL